MKQHPTYRLFSSYLLLLLILWTSKGQAMGKNNCCCTNQKATISCCSKINRVSPEKKGCSRAKKGCTKLQLSLCGCCKEEANWQPLLPMQEKASESSSISALTLYPGSWNVFTLPRALHWEVLYPSPLRHYVPPLLYRDVPILVQSFLL